MKRTLFIMSVLVMMLIALPSAMQAQTYDVNYKNQTIEQIAKDLRKLTGYQFVYKKETVQGIAPITCTYRKATLEQLLNRIFYEEAGLDYEISKGTVILKKAANNRPYFKKNITGMVADENDEPLPGVTVMLKGTSTGVTTDFDGQFTILAEGKDPALELSYVGMKTKTVRVSPKEPFVYVRLEADENLLDEVLVTGYQNIKRENATGSYQLITAKELDERYTSDVASRLEGQIPGLTIYSNGSNGSGEDAMTIRGVGSFQARTSPLVVVDGLPIEGSIETVNAYNIENITVLKDASAAAIYGARASNGVIVITTKRAHSERVSIDFNADLTVSEKQKYDNFKWASASQLLSLEQSNFEYVVSHPDVYDAYLGDYYIHPNYLSYASQLLLRHHLGEISDAEFNQQWSRWQQNDYRQEWRDAMLRTQVLQQYNLAIRTQGKKLNSNIVLNYKGDNTGTVKERDNTFQFSYTGDLNATKWLDLSFGMNVITERAKLQYDEGGMKRITAFQPYQSMWNTDGSLAGMEAAVYLNEPSLSDPTLGLKPETYNLMDELNLNFQRNRRTNLRSYIHAKLNILPELNITTKFQYEDISYKSEATLDANGYDMRHLYNLCTSDGIHHLPEGGILRSNHQNGDYYTFRAQANYQKTFAEKHEVSAIGGFEFRETRYRTTKDLKLAYDDASQTNMTHLINFGELSNLDSSDLGTNYSPLGATPTEDDFATSDVLHRFYSLYLNANYTYDSRYAASFSYRVDKADLFGADPEFRGRPLWSAGLSWNLHNEQFMKEVKWVDALKLRVSYGLTGNIDQNISSYLTAKISVNDINAKKMAVLNTPPNDQLRWEKTESWNVGLDFSLLNNRLSGSLDWYRKTSSDLLALTDIDPTTGWTSLTINNGKARNAGIELQLNAAIIEAATRNDLGINASFSFAYNNNKVLRIDHQPASGYEALRTLHEGRPVNSLFSYRYAGMMTDESGTQSYSWQRADGTVSTANIDTGDFTVNDVVFSGGLDPKYTSSLTPEITWRGFTLTAMFAYYGGHYMRARMEDWTHDGNQFGYKAISNDAVPASYLNYWAAADKSTAIANGYPGFNTIGSYQYIDQTVVHADYLKLRNVVLGYNFSRQLCRKIGVEGLRLRVQMNNVVTWTRNHLNVDPEANDPFSGFTQLKAPKSYTMSLSVNF